MKRMRTGATVVSLLVAATLSAGCSTMSSVGAPPSSTVVVPHGWRTYTYGKAAISVPGDWAVVTDHTCPGTTASGILTLGLSKSSGWCPYALTYSSVTITPLPALLAGATYNTSPCTISLNALRVYVGPCGSSNPPGIVSYAISSLGVEATGTGTITENVTGSGTGTVVGRVLHTLRAKDS